MQFLSTTVEWRRQRFLELNCLGEIMADINLNDIGQLVNECLCAVRGFLTCEMATF